MQLTQIIFISTVREKKTTYADVFHISRWTECSPFPGVQFYVIFPNWNCRSLVVQTNTESLQYQDSRFVSLKGMTTFPLSLYISVPLHHANLNQCQSISVNGAVPDL